MALPYSYSRNVDTLFAVATDTVSGDPINCINEAGEKLLPELAAKGRIFMVNDAKQVSHPILYADGGGVIREYVPGALAPDADGAALDNAAKEILTHAKFDMIASSRNISFAQDMPAGNQLDYMLQLMRSSGMSIFQREEALLVRGETSTSGTVASNSPMSGDTNFNTLPMSLLGIVAAGTLTGGEASPNTDESAESFAGIKLDDLTNGHWNPKTTEAANLDTNAISGANLEAAIQKQILECTFSGVESPDTILVGTTIYEGLIKQMRGRMSPTHLVEDSIFGNESFMLGGCKVIRHRMLNDTSVKYELDEGNTAVLPIYLLNLKSLRMNIVKQDMSIGEGFGFLSSPIEGVFPHPLSTNLFKRVSWKRCYSLDNGRRSFGFIHGITSVT